MLGLPGALFSRQKEFSMVVMVEIFLIVDFHVNAGTGDIVISAQNDVCCLSASSNEEASFSRLA